MSPARRAPAVCLLVALACAGGPTLPEPSPGVPERVLLVSVARLTSDALAEMPLLSALAASGAYAPRVESVAPASAYPSHATLVTGAAPASHGVVANWRLGETGVRASRYAHASHLKVDTLWQRAIEAGQQAISSPLLDDVSINGSTGVLVNITGGEDLSLGEVSQISEVIHDAAGDQAEIIFGAVTDPVMEGEIRVTVIATGFDQVLGQADSPFGSLHVTLL